MQYRGESHGNEFHGSLLNLLGLGFRDSLHINQLFHRCHCNLFVSKTHKHYRFNCVVSAFLELFNITGIDSSPFQLL